MNKTIDFGTVADLYDVYVQWEVDIPFFRAVCKDVGGDVLELMCGTGRLSIPLLQAGIKLCCVDYSREMLDVLQHKLQMYQLTAEVHEADVRYFNLGRVFERILLPFHSLSEIIHPNDRAQALACIHQHLAPNGRLILTAHNPAVQIPRLDGDRHLICDRPIPHQDATLRVWSTARYTPDPPMGNAQQDYEIVDATGQLLETRSLLLQFAILDRTTLEHEVTQAGFTVVNLWGSYAKEPFDATHSPYMIWELRSLTASPT